MIERLSGEQYRALHQALLAAFDLDHLNEMVTLQLGERLDSISGSRSQSDIVFDLIEWAERQGKLDLLLEGAVRAVPASSELAAVQRTLAQPAGEEQRPVANADTLRLAPAQIEEFQRALLSAFSFGELRRLVRMGLEVNLDEIARNGSLRDVTFDLLQWAGQQGQFGRLLDAALAANPANNRLRAFAGSVAASRAGQGEQESALPPPGSASSGAASEIASCAVYALVAGVDGSDDRGKGGHLRSAPVDAEAMARMLAELKLPGPPARLLTGVAATRSALLEAWGALAAKAGAGDVLLFHFSGASVQVGRTDEAEPLTTMLLTADAYRGTHAGVTHDELLAAVAGCPAQVVLLLESGHDGSGALVRHLPDNAVVLAATRENEGLDERPGAEHGLLVETLLRALPAAYAAQGSWRDVYDQVAVAFADSYLRTRLVQTPQLIGDGDACVFRLQRRAVAQPYLPVLAERDALPQEVETYGALLLGHAALSLAGGAQISVYPPASACSGTPLYTVQVMESDPNLAVLGFYVLSGGSSSPIPAASRAVVTSFAPPPSEMLQKAVAPAAARDPAMLALRHMLDLHNPDAPDAPLVTLAAVDETGAPAASAEAGRPFTLDLQTHGDRPLHVSLWAITALGAVRQLFPANTDCYCLYPGAPLRLPVALDMAQPGAAQERVRLKLIAATMPHDLAVLRSAGMGSSVEALFGAAAGQEAQEAERTPVLPGAGVKAKLWPLGATLRVHFLDGDPGLHARVLAAAQEWSRYADIQFAPGSAEEAEVRVTCGQGGGSWSYIGVDSLAIPKGEPTMSLGWLAADSPDAEVRRIVLHEFGHVLGLIHEHQNPNAAIPWDEDKVYAYYAGPPNNWSPAQVDELVLRRYDAALMAVPKPFDPQSIMLFPIPRSQTRDGFETGVNYELSSLDKQSIAAIYPYSQPAA